ncbi:MAG: tetratricopeptide repeat protein [Deltaproteobacteria bacterium]|nr:tetratricopeptide repeat protein [Deltaproteobacteria bacterium]
MDPIEFLAEDDGDAIDVSVIDPEILYNEGLLLIERGENKKALKRFSLVVIRFPESKFHIPSIFNIAVSHKNMNEYEKAKEYYELFIEKSDSLKDKRRGKLAISEVLMETHDLEGAQKILDETGKEELSLLEEIEHKARLGRLKIRQKKLAEAAAVLKEALALSEQNWDNPLMEGNYFVSMALFDAAEIYSILFASIKFLLPVERMEKDLLDKFNLFMKAQNGYIKVIRTPNLFWSQAAGYRIGSLYEKLYKDLLEAEIPPDLTEEERVIYFEELNKFIKPLLKKALAIYENNIASAKNSGIKYDWIRKSEEQLNRLKKMLDEQ